MRTTGWMLIGALVTCPVAVVISFAVSNRLPPREAPPTPEPLSPPVAVAPLVTTPTSQPPAVASELPRIELIDARQSGWLIDARFRYQGRFLDCWVVCEAGGFRHVASQLTTHMAARFVGSGPELSPELAQPASGRIDAILALPVQSDSNSCLFDVSVSRRQDGGGISLNYLERVSLPRRWFGGSVTNGPDAQDLGPIHPGRTVRLYQHAHGREASGLSDGHWLVRLHYRHKDKTERRVGASYEISLAEMDCRSSRLGVPAAWTAAWMVGAAGPFQPPLLAAVPYHEFLDAYAPYVRLAIYARFLADDEVAQVRAAVAKGREAKLGNSEIELSVLKLIESFRSHPDAWGARDNW